VTRNGSGGFKRSNSSEERSSKMFVKGKRSMSEDFGKEGDSRKETEAGRKDEDSHAEVCCEQRRKVPREPQKRRKKHQRLPARWKQ